MVRSVYSRLVRLRFPDYLFGLFNVLRPRDALRSARSHPTLVLVLLGCHRWLSRVLCRCVVVVTASRFTGVQHTHACVSQWRGAPEDTQNRVADRPPIVARGKTTTTKPRRWRRGGVEGGGEAEGNGTRERKREPRHAPFVSESVVSERDND